MFSTIIVNLKILLRDKATLFLIMLFPTILVFLLGNLLGNLDNAEGKIEPMTVEYKVETTDSTKLAAVQSFLEGLESNDDLKLKETDDINISKGKLNNGDIACAVVFSGDDIRLYEGLDNIQNRAMNIIVNSFSEYTASLTTVQKNDPAKLTQLESILEGDKIKEKDFGYKRTMLDYYAVAMIVMILFMGGAIGGSSVIYEGRINGTLRRMAISPKNRISLYIQIIIGSIPQTLIQVIAIMIPSVFIFGANYARSLSANMVLVIMLVLVGIAINAVFTIVGMFVKSNPTMVIMPILWILMFISGTFSKEIYIEGVTELSPVWMIQNAAFQLTIFDDWSQSIITIAICLGITVIATITGAILFNRKEVVL